VDYFQNFEATFPVPQNEATRLDPVLWRILHNEELNILYSLSFTVTMIK
jgi:hypothetical protein